MSDKPRVLVRDRELAKRFDELLEKMPDYETQKDLDLLVYGVHYAEIKDGQPPKRIDPRFVAVTHSLMKAKE